MQSWTTKKIIAAISLGLAGSIASAAYPERPITMVVGFSPGGTGDSTARILAESMGPLLGQSIVVENKAGANGNIATSFVSRAAPDGYTLFVTSIGHAVNPAMYKNVTYDPVKDFTPIGKVLTAPNVMVVPKSSPFNNVKELIDYAKKNPGMLNVASSGIGTSVHLSAELFKQLAGVDVTHVPYKGTGTAMPDLLAGTTQLMFPNLPSALPHVKRGDLKAFGVTTKQRSSAAQDIPTLAEAGVPNYDMSTWYGMIGPAGMDKDVVARLNEVLQKVLNDPSVRARLNSQGADPAPGSPEEFGAFVAQETEKWAKLVKESKLEIN
ncbi:tripartite tricarboxylate transporter substrate binding protein [Pollutimonas sp. H1-120]|uniref:Bug family tripartite tricarboxylate transporter substrate binding protein n=1 Tax=Pollutimonas sp. H1-120 TaxID=3148824 RepID=UPI003B51D9CF